MDQYHHSRIDKGQPRVRPDRIGSPRTESGTFALVHNPERRAEIILSVPKRILAGETTTQIAESYNLPASTLRAWLIGNKATNEARQQFLEHEVTERAEQIDTATDPLSLARAREAFRAWSWITERRHKDFALKQEPTSVIQPILNITINTGIGEHTGVMSNSTPLEIKDLPST